MRLIAILLLLATSLPGQVTVSGKVDASGRIDVLTFVPTPPTAACAGYALTIPITLAKASGSDQTPFLVPISGRDYRLATAANGGNCQNTATNSIGRTGCADWIYATSTGSLGTILKYETSFYDPVTGAFETWVKIPTLHSASNDTIYLCTNNSSVTTSQQDLSFCSDLNYVGIWHFPNGTSLDTINTCDGVAATQGGGTAGLVPAAIRPGVADGGGLFTGGNGFNCTTCTLAWENDTSALKPSSVTMEAWSWNHLNTSLYHDVLSKPYRNGSWSAPFRAYGINLVPGGDVVTNITTSGTEASAQSSNPTLIETWYHLAGTFDQTTVKTWINGTNDGTASKSGAIDYGGNTTPIALAANSNTSLQAAFDGKLDELRVASDVKTANYLATAYSLENPYSSAYIFGDSSYAKPQVRQQCSGENGPGASSCTLRFPITSGGVLIAYVQVTDDTVCGAVSDSLGNTWTQQVYLNHTGTLNNYVTCIVTAPIVNTGSITITSPTVTSSNGASSILIQEVKGVTVTGIVTASNNTPQPSTFSATSPGADSFLGCLTRGPMTLTTPSSLRLAEGPNGSAGDEQHGARASVAFGIVGSGTQNCALNSVYSGGGQGAVMVILPYSP